MNMMNVKFFGKRVMTIWGSRHWRQILLNVSCVITEYHLLQQRLIISTLIVLFIIYKLSKKPFVLHHILINSKLFLEKGNKYAARKLVVK